ncbi:MAG TPA: NAD-dependent deacylase [Terriglobia bacterium]|nr:NAD-dependent deacylase [Terriglobia bacterium]
MSAEVAGSNLALAADVIRVDETIRSLRRTLKEASSVVALTGAGISAESGIRTFRGAGGLWRQYRPEKLATPEAFERDPKLVWEWYDWRRAVIQAAKPNPGHAALAELESRTVKQGGSFTLITQNVDGLHDRAGSRGIVKLHGDIWTVRCVGCGRSERNDQVPLLPLPPHCECGALMRPGVVWFGEPLPEDEWERATKACAAAQIVLVIGTSATVYPAAGLAQAAQQAGAKMAVVNPEPTALDEMAEWVLRGPSGELLPGLL